MSQLTSVFENSRKDTAEIRIQAAAVQNYRGGAAGVVIGTGYATPLVPGTAGMQFIGVYSESNNNSLGTAGTIVVGAPNSGYSSWVRVIRTGVFVFNQSGLTQADVGRPAYFLDDNTITDVPGACMAGVIVTVDEGMGLAEVDITFAVMPITRTPMVVLSASGAISPRNAQVYAVTKAGVAALTLAAPTATVDDGVEVTITSTTANAHTLTATGLLKTGTASVNEATFAAEPGAGLSLIAYQGLWYVTAAVGITFS